MIENRRTITLGTKKKPLRDEPFLTAEDELEYQREGQPMVPRAATLEAGHIIRAYVNGDPNAQRRIDEYGKLEREKWVALMAPFRPDPNPGSPIITFWNAGPLSTNGKNGSRPDPLPDQSASYDDPAPESSDEESPEVHGE